MACPLRRQAIIWTNDGILLIRPLETNFSETLIKIPTFWFQKMHLKMSSGKWQPFRLGLNVLTSFPDGRVHGVNLGSSRVLSAPGGPHVGPMILAIRVVIMASTQSEKVLVHKYHMYHSLASHHGKRDRDPLELLNRESLGSRNKNSWFVLDESRL